MIPNILIVDDVSANLVALKALLRGLEIEVNIIQAASGSEALEKVLENEFALILTDVQMPEMDGFELASILQDHDEWNQIPIIFITAAYRDEQNRDRGYGVGAVDYIQKPIEEHILLSKVTIFLRLYEQRRQIEEINSSLERRVAERTAELSHTQALAKIGGWSINPIDWTETLSSRVRRILAGEMREDVQIDPNVNSLFSFLDKENRDYHLNQMKKVAIEMGDKYDFEVEVKNKKGIQCHLFCTTLFIYQDGVLRKIEGAIQDVSERQRANEIIEYLELHDRLTRLPNRNAFHETIVKSVSEAKASAHSLAVMFMDLDNFKHINDSYGQTVGNLVLTDISQRLLEIGLKDTFLARVGGDEFAFILEDADNLDLVVDLAEKAMKVVGKTLNLFGDDITPTAGVGIAIFPQDGNDGDSILKAADLALHRSKADGGDVYNFYDEAMSRAFHLRNDLIVQLEKAIKKNEFELYYQPKIDLKTNNLMGAEALIRWNHPTDGLVYPDHFIPLAESTGLIRELGDWIISDVCKTVVNWGAKFGRPIPIAINVSVEQIKSKEFVQFLQKTMEESGATSEQIEIEITETSLLESIEVTGETLENIKGLGIDIALDDFGTGYSSLTHLKSLLATSLKIDRSFIQNIMTDTSDAHIADMVISVAHKLNMNVVAEGIEHLEQCERLRQMNCDVGQGYYYSKPLREKDFLLWCEQYKNE